MSIALVTYLFTVTQALRQERDELGEERTTRNASTLESEHVSCSEKLVQGEPGFDWLDAHDCGKSPRCQWSRGIRSCIPRCSSPDNQNHQNCESPCVWAIGTCHDPGTHGSRNTPMQTVAKTENGWKILGVADSREHLADDEDSAHTDACTTLKAVLEDGGAAIVRVGVENADETSLNPRKALFQTLVPFTSPNMSFRDWNEPLEDAIYGRVQGASEAYDVAARERMEAQVDRMALVLNRLRTQVPPDFGYVWVLMILEHERESSSFVAPVKLSVASFRYIGDNKRASGAGGMAVNMATNSLSRFLPRYVDKCFDGRLRTLPYTKTVRGTEIPRELLASLYVREFASSSQALARQRLERAENALSGIATFVHDCKASLTAGKLFGTCNVDRANQFVTDYFRAPTPGGLSGNAAHTLIQFLKANGGVIYLKEQRKELNQERGAANEKRLAQEALALRQAGPDRIPDAGTFSLSSSNSSKTMSLFFAAALSTGNWVCLRSEDALEDCHYQILGSSDIALESEFHTWQNSIFEDGRTPLTLGTIGLVPHDQLKRAITQFLSSRKVQFDTARAAVQSLDQAQTLCVHRFQAPFRQDEDAARAKPDLFDFQTSWKGTGREVKIVFTPTVLAVKKWFKEWEVTTTDVLFSSSPISFKTYEEAVQKYQQV